ncbi:MAG TPA: hypothetical protein VI341_01365 [Actinomycetota bacterium]
MGRISRRLAASLLCIAVVLPLSASSAAAITDQERAAAGIGYLRTVQEADGSIPAFSPIGSTADAVLAVYAAGVGKGVRTKAIRYLAGEVEAGNVGTIGLQAKVALAASAAGIDPRDFGGKNLINPIRAAIGDDGHIGDTAVFDQALAVLALETVGVPRVSTTTWLLDAQCPDGGWAYDAPYASGTDDDHCDGDGGSDTDFFTSDTNTTAYVIQALEYINRDDYTVDPFTYLNDVRDPDRGGWGYSAGFGTDANSTALVLQAYAADEQALPAGSRKALRKLQYASCGAWAFTRTAGGKGDPDVGATIGAIPGVRTTPLPIPLAPPTALAATPKTPAC